MTIIASVKHINYEGSWPKELDPALEPLWSKVARGVWNIVSVILFPIGVCRLIRHYLSQYAFSLIVPGRGREDQPFLEELGQDLLVSHQGESITLKTADAATIDAAFFPGKESGKAIIYVGGNCEQWEEGLPNVPKGPSILMLNPRGTGRSRGSRTPEGYALDVYTAYQFLIKHKKFDPDRILLIGRSMGGANGTRGAALVQKEYPDKKINVINLASFSYLSTEIHSISGKIVKSFTGLPHFLGSFPTWVGAKLLNLELDVKSAWDTLKGRRVIFYHPDDEIIPYEASLAKAVQNTTTEINRTDSQWHNAPLCCGALEKYNRIIQRILNLSAA